MDGFETIALGRPGSRAAAGGQAPAAAPHSGMAAVVADLITGRPAPLPAPGPLRGRAAGTAAVKAGPAAARAVPLSLSALAGGRVAPVGGMALPDLDARPAPPPVAAPEPEGPPLEELLAAARAEGFAAGRSEGEAAGHAAALAGIEQRMAESLAALPAALQQAQAAADALAEEHAGLVARLLIAALDTALPAAAARLGPALILRTATALRPALEDRQEARLHVHPDLAGPLAGQLPHWIVEADADLPPGDARIQWRGGGAALDLDARRRAIRDTLATLDLTQDGDIP
jgi:flagellar biosynthesis/type III secretory pathway protein FliH